VTIACPGKPPAFTTAMWYAFLLRVDVRRGMDPGDPGIQMDFLCWWAVFGRKEYPLHAYLGDALKEVLWETGQENGLPRIVSFLYKAREDLQDQFPLHSPENKEALLDWVFVSGLVEHGLADTLAGSVRGWLSACPGGRGGGNRLMGMLWKARGDLQAAFDLSTPGGRDGFAHWFQADAAPELEVYRKALSGSGDVDTGMWDDRDTPPTARIPGVNIIGFAKGEFGIGEDARMVARALESAGIPFTIVNIPTGPGIRQEDVRLEASISNSQPYAINIFCLSGFDLAGVYLSHGEGIFEGFYNIGFLPWEFSQWPGAWKGVLDFVDEIWASSQYTLRAFKDLPGKPVHHMPLPVEVAGQASCQREEFGLPGVCYVVLYVFDVNSYLGRKNPMAAVQAFQEAFGEDVADVRLVLKATRGDPGNPAWEQLVETCGEDPRIQLLVGTMGREDLANLYASSDCYLSLHRSEGFGRTMAEAMLYRLPVIATGATGNADFLDDGTGYPVPSSPVTVAHGEYPFAGGMVWQEPDVPAAAGFLRRIHGCPGEARKIADAGQKFIRDNYSPAKAGKVYKDRLQTVFQQLPGACPNRLDPL